MNPLDCTGCTHCCNYLAFGMDLSPLNKEQIERKLNYYEIHGCEIKGGIKPDEYVIIVPSPCKFVDPGVGCKIYLVRPWICKHYDCRTAKYLPKGGNYNK